MLELCRWNVQRHRCLEMYGVLTWVLPGVFGNACVLRLPCWFLLLVSKLLRSKSRILGSSAEFPRDHPAHSQFESQLPRESCLQWPNLLQRPMSCQLRSNRPPMRLLLGLTSPLLNVLNPGNPMGHAVIPATMKMVMNEATLLKPMGECG